MTPHKFVLSVLREDAFRLSRPLGDPGFHLDDMIRSHHRKHQTEIIILMKFPRNRAVLTVAENEHNWGNDVCLLSHEAPALAFVSSTKLQISFW